MIVFAGNSDLEIGCTSFLLPEYFHYGIDKYWDYRHTESEHRAPLLFNESSDFHKVFFRASLKSKRMEKNRCILLFSTTISHFQGQFYKIPGQFQDKWHYMYFEIPGVFQDHGQIQGLFQVCANPEHEMCLSFAKQF